MSEIEIQKDIQVALAEVGSIVYRNNVGMAYTKKGRPVRFGLHPGSSDLIGWTRRVITPEMIGSVVAVFTSVEVKTKRGKPSPTQEKWLRAVRANGGIWIVARSVDEAIDGIRSK